MQDGSYSTTIPIALPFVTMPDFNTASSTEQSTPIVKERLPESLALDLDLCMGNAPSRYAEAVGDDKFTSELVASFLRIMKADTADCGNAPARAVATTLTALQEPKFARFVPAVVTAYLSEGQLDLRLVCACVVWMVLQRLPLSQEQLALLGRGMRELEVSSNGVLKEAVWTGYSRFLYTYLTDPKTVQYRQLPHPLRGIQKFERCTMASVIEVLELRSLSTALFSAETSPVPAVSSADAVTVAFSPDAETPDPLSVHHRAYLAIWSYKDFGEKAKSTLLNMVPAALGKNAPFSLFVSIDAHKCVCRPYTARHCSARRHC